MASKIITSTIGENYEHGTNLDSFRLRSVGLNRTGWQTSGHLSVTVGCMMSTGARYNNAVKMSFLKDYAKLPVSASGRKQGVTELRKSYGIAPATMDRWIKTQGGSERPGRKCAIESTGVERSSEVYFLGELSFPTKEAAIRYALEELGGLTVKTTTMTTTITKVRI